MRGFFKFVSQRKMCEERVAAVNLPKHKVLKSQWNRFAASITSQSYPKQTNWDTIICHPVAPDCSISYRELLLPSSNRNHPKTPLRRPIESIITLPFSSKIPTEIASRRQRPAPSFANEWLRGPLAARLPAALSAPPAEPGRFDGLRYEPVRRWWSVRQAVPVQSAPPVSLRPAQMSRLRDRPSKQWFLGGKCPRKWTHQSDYDQWC